MEDSWGAITEGDQDHGAALWGSWLGYLSWFPLLSPKYHRLRGRKAHFLSHFGRLGRARPRRWQLCVSEGSLLVRRRLSPACPHRGKGCPVLWGLLYQDTDPVHGLHPHDLINPQPPRPILSCWRSCFNSNLGRRKHSTHNSAGP